MAVILNSNNDNGAMTKSELKVVRRSYEIGTLEELSAPVSETYNDESSRLLDAMSDELLALYELGDCSKAKMTEAVGFAKLINDLSGASTVEEFDAVLAKNASDASRESVVRYATYRRARLSA
ncbi:MAG: hypothetical protein MJ154_03795 [Candidatus Saccharibacteria bacterium]|nr:hypothetical protein [Candidatus Saccharibacteria bacterium]